jgi:hypothetical protein
MWDLLPQEQIGELLMEVSQTEMDQIFGMALVLRKQ